MRMTMHSGRLAGSGSTAIAGTTSPFFKNGAQLCKFSTCYVQLQLQALHAVPW